MALLRMATSRWSKTCCHEPLQKVRGVMRYAEKKMPTGLQFLPVGMRRARQSRNESGTEGRRIPCGSVPPKPLHYWLKIFFPRVHRQRKKTTLCWPEICFS
jgi:hypothetical protein